GAGQTAKDGGPICTRRTSTRRKAAASASPAPGTPRSGITHSACRRFGEAGGSSRTAQTSRASRSAGAVLTRRLPMSELEPEHDPNQADDEYVRDPHAALDAAHR